MRHAPGIAEEGERARPSGTRPPRAIGAPGVLKVVGGMGWATTSTLGGWPLVRSPSVDNSVVSHYSRSALGPRRRKRRRRRRSLLRIIGGRVYLESYTREARFQEIIGSCLGTWLMHASPGIWFSYTFLSLSPPLPSLRSLARTHVCAPRATQSCGTGSGGHDLTDQAARVN